MGKLRLDINGLYEYQQNRYPYLLIDIAEEVIPGVSAKGYKNLTKDDWFFKCHFEGDPNMPGLLQIESLVQMAALSVVTLPNNKGKIVYLTSANNLKFKKKILIGDKLNIETKLTSWKRGVGECFGQGFVNSQLACQANFGIIVPDILNKFKVNSKK